MAWIRYYIRLSHALVAVAARILPDGVTPAHAAKSGTRKSARSCCVAARVRRSTAATGE